MRQRFARIASLLCLVSIAAGLTGCAQAVLLGLLLGGPPSIEPDFDAQTGLSLTDEDIRVAVICYVPEELRWDYENLDQEIVSAVSQRLFVGKVDVKSPDVVRKWLLEHPDWETPEEVGAAMEVDYVVDIELNDFGLYEEGSETLYRGRTDAQVNVIAMDDRESGFAEGERIYNKKIDLVYPTRVPRSAEDESPEQFKRDYLSRLSESIGWIFIERFHGDMIGWAT